MRSISTFIIIYLTALCGAPGLAQNLPFTEFGQANGYAAEGAYQIAQDELGRIVIASEGAGLIRFDGKKFTSWDRRSGFGSDTVRCLLPLHQGGILAGTDGAGIWLLSNDTLFQAFHGHFRGMEIRSMVQKEHQLWVATLGNGLWTCTGDSCRQAELNCMNIRTLLLGSDQTLYIGTDEGLFTFGGRNFEAVKDSLINDRVLTLYEDRQQQLWAGMQKGVVYRSRSEWHSFHPLSNERVRSITEDQHGDLWFGTRTGLWEWHDQNGRIYHYTTANGLTSARIRHIYADADGKLWMSSYFGGLCRLNSQSSATFSAEHGFPETSITAIRGYADSLLFFGTIDGDIYQWADGEELEQWYRGDDTLDGVRSLETYCDTTTGRCYLEAGFEHGKRCRFDLQGGSLISQSSATERTLLKSFIIEQKSLQLYTDHLATENDRLSTFDLACDQLTAVTHTDSHLYIGTPCGLFLFDHTKGTLSIPTDRTSIKPIEGSEDLNITSLIADRTGNVWIGTQDRGVFRFDGSIERIRERYLNDPRVLQLTLDYTENLWVTTRKGITMLELDPSQSMVLNHRWFGADQSLIAQIQSVESSFQEEHFLWLGTSRGLVRLDPFGDFIDESPPGLALTGLRLHYESVDWTRLGFVTEESLPVEPSFNYDQNHLSFDFVGIETTAADRVRFQCRLDGLEDDWVNLAEVSTHTYPQLTSGTYTFMLRAQNRDGQWSDEALEYRFTIHPPFWQNPWFIALTVFAFGTLIYLLVQWRLRQLRKLNERLARTVQKRTEELSIAKAKSDDLLLNILPKETAEELKEKGRAQARKYNEASVLFSDLKGFTKLSEEIGADQLVSLLDEAFKRFDRLCDRYGVEKIKTIGDAYMCATGIPSEDPAHALNMTRFAISMLEEMRSLNQRNREQGLPECEIRIGIHSGPLIAGVVGEKKFAYDVWGDTVNTASRMESSGTPDRINISASTYQRVKDSFICESRGKVAAKNKGDMEMYFVIEERMI